MNRRPTQFGVRESTASPRQHASRLTVDSLPLTSDAAPRGLQHPQPTRVLASRTSGPDNPIITMPLESGTGGQRGDSAETISAPATVITANELGRAPLTPEDRKSTRLNSSHRCISYAVFCLKKKKR